MPHQQFNLTDTLIVVGILFAVFQVALRWDRVCKPRKPKQGPKIPPGYFDDFEDRISN
jgi:hypothetical protein